MGTGEPLAARVAAELARPAPPAAADLTRAILERHGQAVAGVVFYGSCLRQGSHEGVLDFYVIVDDYRRCYDSLYLRLANALLPPNVFFLTLETGLGTLRCKYAVLSAKAFARGVSAAANSPYFWARFCQPALVTHARDEEARRRIEEGCAEAIVTLVRRLGPFLPARGDLQRFSAAALWQTAFRRTYSAELRTESQDTVRGHYAFDPARYDAAAGAALEILRERGWLSEVSVRGNAFEVRMPARRRWRSRLRWRLFWPLGKLLAFLRLLKNATTFGDWVPYILWKLERHTGRPVEVTERQRRHPLIFGWPVVARLLWRRDIF